MNRPNTVQLLTSRLGGEAYGEMCSLRSRKVRTRPPLALSSLLVILYFSNPFTESTCPPGTILLAVLQHPSLPVPMPQSICHLHKHQKNCHLTSLQPALALHSHVLPLPNHTCTFRAAKLQSNSRSFGRTELYKEKALPC